MGSRRGFNQLLKPGIRMNSRPGFELFSIV